MKNKDRKYREIFEQSPVGVMFYDKQGNLTDINQSALEIVGITREASLNINLFDNPQIARKKEEIIKRKSLHFQGHVDFKIKPKSGLYEPKNEGKTVVEYIISATDSGYLLQIQDITERKKIEEHLQKLTENLKEEKNKLMSLINNIPDEVWFANTTGDLELINPSVLRQFGNNLLNKKVEHVVKNLQVFRTDGSPRPLEESPLLRSLKGEKVKNEEEIIKIPATEKLRHRQVNAVPVKNDEGDIIGSISLVRDITELNDFENEIMKLNKDLNSRINELNTFFDNLPMGLAITYEKNAEHVYGNPILENSLGMARGSNLSGSAPNEKLPFKSYKEGQELSPEELPIQRAISTEKPVQSYEYDIIRDDGRLINFHGHAVPLFDENGRVRGAVAAFDDVTDLKKKDKALRDNENLFRTVVENSRDGINLLDLKTGKYVFMSPAQIELTGFTAEEMNNFSVEEAYSRVHPEDRELSINQQQEITSGHKNEITTEYRWKVKSGEYRWFNDSRKVIRDENGNPTAMVGVSRDVTSQKKHEEHLQKLLVTEKQLSEKLQNTNQELVKMQVNLRETIQRLEISNQELEQFAYVASHDLQEPLRMVASFTQLLEMRYRDRLDDDANDYIDFIVEGSQRMKHLIDDLLTFSRLTNEQGEFLSTDLNQVVENLIKNSQIYIEENQAKITFDKLPTIRCDPSQIMQVFQNLISNAIKFQSDKPPAIHISAFKDGNWTFSVSDNGIGIATEHQEKIFKIFNRLHTREEYEGTGIGLSICKKIIARHHGQIWVESQEGEGSTFYFTIPHKI